VSYKISFVRAAEKEFLKLPRIEQKKLAEKIEALKKGPNHACRKLAGFGSRYRLRVGQYRVIFDVQNQKLLILVLRIGHRQGVYKKMPSQ